MDMEQLVVATKKTVEQEDLAVVLPHMVAEHIPEELQPQIKDMLEGMLLPQALYLLELEEVAQVALGEQYLEIHYQQTQGGLEELGFLLL